MGGFGIWELLIILVIVALLFGTKKLKGMGSDLGGAVKGFQNAMKDSDEKGVTDESPNTIEGETVDGQTAEANTSDKKS